LRLNSSKFAEISTPNESRVAAIALADGSISVKDDHLRHPTNRRGAPTMSDDRGDGPEKKARKGLIQRIINLLRGHVEEFERAEEEGRRIRDEIKERNRNGFRQPEPPSS